MIQEAAVVEAGEVGQEEEEGRRICRWRRDSRRRRRALWEGVGRLAVGRLRLVTIAGRRRRVMDTERRAVAVDTARRAAADTRRAAVGMAMAAAADEEATTTAGRRRPARMAMVARAVDSEDPIEDPTGRRRHGTAKGKVRRLAGGAEPEASEHYLENE